MTVRLPTTRPIWCVQHITNNGPVTDYHDTQQAASNQWQHLGTDKAVMWESTYIEDRPEEEVAA